MMPSDQQIRAFLSDLKKGDHLALLWAPPKGAAVSESVVCYLRVSSGRQLEGEGLPDQWEACVAYAQRQGWAIAGLYVDPAISGRKEQRPAIDRLKLDARTKRFRYALFYRVNRMGRNAPAMFGTADEVERCGVEVVSATEHFNRHSAAGKLTFGMLAVFAQYGSDQLSEVMKHTLASKARRGAWIGPLPLGYSKDASQCLVPNEAAPVPQRAFALYATGVHSYSTVADDLNAAGYRTQEGKLFGRESVRTLLRNRAYIGIVTCDDKEYPGQHEPLISEELWQACARIRQERERGNHGQSSPKLGGLLSEIAHCGACGERLWYQPQREDGRVVRIYYYCAGRHHRTCQAPMVPAVAVEGQTLDLIRALALPTDILDAAIALAAQRLEQQQEAPGVRPEVIREQLRRLGVSYRLGDLADAVYLAERQRLMALLKEAPLPRPVADLRDVASRLRSVGDWLSQGDTAQQRVVVRSIVARVWAKREGLTQWLSTDLYQPLVVASLALCGGWLMGLEPTTA